MRDILVLATRTGTADERLATPEPESSRGSSHRGAGAGLGLPIIGELLGYTQAARYAHLDADPLLRASEMIAGQIAAALNDTSTR